MPNTKFTSAKGVHAKPLAEFCIMVILMWSKKYFQTELLKSKKIWQRFSTNDISNQIVGIVGVGAIGSEIAKYCKYFNMNVFGIKTQPRRADVAIFENQRRLYACVLLRLSEVKPKSSSQFIEIGLSFSSAE